MPIKLPKGFQRRRSSGNILDTSFDSPSPESSFRVLERPVPGTDLIRNGHPGQESLKRRSAVRPKSSPMQSRRSRSYEEGYQASHQSSDNTFNTVTTQASRDSYASTTPSSVDMNPHNGPAEDSPPKPDSPTKSSSHTFSFKSAARTLTFSSRTKPPPIPDQDVAAISAAHRPSVRERAMTESSYASTAVPPKIDFGSDLGLGSADFGADFGDIFAKRRSVLLEQSAQPGTNMPRTTADSSLSPNQFESRATFGSPNSYVSHTSDDKLMQSPPLPNYYGFGEYEPSFGVDTDAELVMAAVRSGRFVREHNETPSRQLADRPRVTDSKSSAQTSTFNATASPASNGATLPPASRLGMLGNRETTPKTQADDLDDEPLFDPAKSARLAQFNTRNLDKAKQPSKVMTPAEFEHYRAQKDLALDDSKSTASDDSETYEDVDETERERQAAKQRRKQEAQLAVYRQQMMKVTGEQPSELPTSFSRPKLDRQSMSTPNLLSSNHSMHDPMGGSKDEDEDEDIPLGVLQAHGFPSKSRPPSRLAPSGLGARPASQMSSYPAPHGSTRNDAAAGGGGNSSLPVFARNLPTDPYLGANLVNHSTRESLQFGAGSPTSAQGPALPPGGLVGVIAGEERARAMRRGSPNTRGTYDNAPLPPHMQPPMTVSGMPGMPPMVQPMSQAEQAQMQVSNQMAQMMQMQMQWMQQMMQMQGMSPQQMQQMQQMQMGMQMPPHQSGFLSPNQQRPGSQNSNHQRSNSRQSGFMSALNLPGPSQAAYVPSSNQSVYGMPANGYAPSIAPSERSNIGQPSRYRPVSSLGVDGPRTMSMSRQSFQGLNGQDSRSPSRLGPGDGNRNTTIRVIDRPKNEGHPSDEDDDEGWAELKKKKEERKSRWRRTKKPSGPLENENGGLEGLYYEG